jgi:hypothetical protein
VWKERLSNPRDPFPTTKAGEKPPKGINPDTYVGIFEGAMQYKRQIYRPFWNCRMCSNTPPFCPVCEPYMSSYLAQFLPQGGGEGDGHRDGPTREPRDVGTGAPPAADCSWHPADDQAAAPGSYIHMILQVTAQGDVEVLSAKEVPGKLVTSRTPSSDFLIVVRTNAGRVVSVQSLPGDPFGVRVFRDQKDVAKDKGKKVEHVRKTTMILQVPNYTIDRALDDRISIQIYKIKKGALREKIGPEIFNQLTDQECLESVLMISADRLLHQLRDKGQRFR